MANPQPSRTGSFMRWSASPGTDAEVASLADEPEIPAAEQHIAADRGPSETTSASRGRRW